MSMLAMPHHGHTGVGPAMGSALSALLLLAGFVLLSNTIDPPVLPAPEPTIEVWHGNSASITPAP